MEFRLLLRERCPLLRETDTIVPNYKIGQRQFLDATKRAAFV